MYDAIVADVDTEVSDKEAAQKAMQYMFYATTSTDQTTGASIPLSDTEKEATVEKSRQMHTREDMQRFVNSLGE